jgi:hypothetical protein
MHTADEDDMVLDPDLDKHLAHWGINMLQVRARARVCVCVCVCWCVLMFGGRGCLSVGSSASRACGRVMRTPNHQDTLANRDTQRRWRRRPRRWLSWRST